MLKRLNVVAILRKQLKEARSSVARLDEAIRVLERLAGKSPGGRRGRRTMSAAARRRIAAAQRARWKKLRLVKK